MQHSAEQWSQIWGDNFPTENDCQLEVIKHHADACGIQLTKEIIWFAKSLWNEGNLS